MSRIRHVQAGTPSELLRHVIERPELVAAVRDLEGAQLAQLITHVGLEDAGEIVALASTEQLVQVFDEDLFRATTVGGDEDFQPARFGLWLHVLSEAGDAFLAGRLSSLPRELLVLGIHRLILVLDMDALAVDMEQLDEDEANHTEKALERGLCEEWEEFRLIARDAEHWDVLWNALLALDRDHHDLVRHIIERCAALDTEFIEDNGGLYEVLTSDEMLESDISAEREDRLAAAGHVAPADARAFLKLADRAEPPSERDPLTRAYFRELSHANPKQPARLKTTQAPSQAIAALTQLIQSSAHSALALPKPKRGAKQVRGEEAGEAPGAALAQSENATPHTRLDAALNELRDLDPVRASERLEEIAYLANVLIAGGVHEGRKPRPVEALELALEACDRGLTRLLDQPGRSAKPEPAEQTQLPTPLSEAAQVLFTTPADILFRIGYRA